MMAASEFVAGVGVEDATAQEGGADQDVENVEHYGFPRSATMPPHAARHVALRKQLISTPYRIDGT
jgi:hypothetical protein